LANAHDFASLMAVADKQTKGMNSQHTSLFATFSLGLAANRDEWAYSFQESDLEAKIKKLIRNFNSELFRLRGEESFPSDLDSWVNGDPKFIKWTDRLKDALRGAEPLKYSARSIRESLYRPYVAKYVYFDHLLNQRRYQQHHIFPTSGTESENRVLWCKTGGDWAFFALIARSLVDLLPQGGSQCLPFYVYNEDGSNRRENITDWALEQFRTHYNDKNISKWDIFHYVYGVLHHPGYRTKFADNLKRELPRIPFAPDFRAFSHAGELLAALHLDYEKLDPWELKWVETPGVPLSYRVQKMKLSKDKTMLTVNESLALGGIPPEVFEYRLGNRSALEWVIDQYQVFEDKRSGIVSDPNREDDPQYIVRLVGQVVRVSIETVKIVISLPPEFAPAVAKG
jgi:predicted helicase